MKLTKSRDDEMVAGVLGGIGEYYHIDPTLLRIGFIILMFATPLPLIPLYIVAALVMPEAPKKEEGVRPRQARKRRGSREFNRKSRPKRDFREVDERKQASSSRKEVTEDDWSDF